MRYVTAEQLMNTVDFMHENRMYEHLIFYIEACESGSMFNGLLSENISVWVSLSFCFVFLHLFMY